MEEIIKNVMAKMGLGKNGIIQKASNGYNRFAETLSAYLGIDVKYEKTENNIFTFSTSNGVKIIYYTTDNGRITDLKITEK